MNLQTILELLYKNGLQSIVTRTIQLDENIPFKYAVDTEIIVEVTNSELRSSGLKIKETRGYGNIKCPILAIDKWDIDTPYVIRLPDGSLKKLSEERIDNKISSSLSEVEAIAPPPPDKTPH